MVAAACASEADRNPLEASGGDDSGGTSSDTDTSDTTDGTDSEADGTGTLDWSDCGGAECASLDVPVDYSQPEGETLTLSVARVPAAARASALCS